jgi:hypothetical protein
MLVFGQLIRVFNLTGWVMASIWHLNNGFKLSVYNVDIPLPLRWWVFAKEKNEISLTAVPPNGIRFWGVVTIKSEILDSTSLTYNASKLSHIKSAGDLILKFNRFEKMTIDRSEAFGAVYDIWGFEKHQYEIWMVPNKRVTFIAKKIHKDRRDLLLRLLHSVKFKSISFSRLWNAQNWIEIARQVA